MFSKEVAKEGEKYRAGGYDMSTQFNVYDYSHPSVQ
jgi:hypothetical protein